MSHHLRMLVFLFPIALFLVFLSIKVASQDTYTLLCREDSVIEYTEFLFYILSSVFSVLISLRFLRNELALHGVLHGILAIGLLFVAMEEISWGQRIFGIESPDFFSRHSYHYQKEISFHNLYAWRYPAYIIYTLTGVYGAFAWSFARLFVPKEKRESMHIFNLVVPDWFISSYFFLGLFIWVLVIIKWFSRDTGIADAPLLVFIGYRDQEPSQLLFSLGFFFFVVVNYIRSRSKVAIASTRRL